MNYLEFDTLIRQSGNPELLIKNSVFADRITHSLDNAKGTVFLYSGELHPGAYNGTEIPKALSRLLKDGKEDVYVTWGPATFFAHSENKPHSRNDLCTDCIETHYEAPHLTVRHSYYRQGAHAWVIGDWVYYQKPYRPGADAEKKETMAIKVGFDISQALKEDLRAQTEKHITLPLSSKAGDTLSIFRPVDIKLNNQKGLDQVITQAEPDEAITYYVEQLQALPEVKAIPAMQGRVDSINNKVSIDLVTYIFAEHRTRKLIDGVRQAKLRTCHRFLEMYFDFHNVMISKGDVTKLFDKNDMRHVGV